MIPKTIHYCWFGGNPVPKDVEKCISSWKRKCPNYNIVCWNESNFDVKSHTYIKEAYEAKRWAFVSDLARLLIVYNNGGIYLDTDVELLKSLDGIIKDNEFFFAIEKDTNIKTGEESIHVATGLGFGAEKNNQVLRNLINEYDDAHFYQHEGKYDLTPCPVRNTDAFKKMGVKIEDKMIKLKGGTIYPSEFFCPEEYSSSITRFTTNTVSIHHYTASWKTSKERMKDKARIVYRKLFKRG